MPSVFISYRHENPAHTERVRQLAVRLRDAGVDVIFDGFEEEKHLTTSLAPTQGWPMWSIQQANADRVIIIASSGWFRVFNRHEPAPLSGRGAAAEAECIGTRMYQAGGNTFAVIAYFDHPTDLADLPPFLVKCARLDATQSAPFDKMLNWAKGLAPLPTPDVPAPKVPWPSDVLFPPGLLADRHEPCEFFRAMLTGNAAENVSCIIAGSGTGKSKLLDVFYQVGSAALASCDRIAHVRNLQEYKIDDLIDKLCTSLGGTHLFPRYEQCVVDAKPSTAQRVAFLTDLRLRVDPSLIILDTWDKGTEELRDWISGHLVPAVSRASAIKLIIAGQPHVSYPAKKSGEIEHFALDHIAQHEWEEFIDHRYPGDAETLKPTVRLLLKRAASPAQGVKTIAHILELLEQPGGALA